MNREQTLNLIARFIFLVVLLYLVIPSAVALHLTLVVHWLHEPQSDWSVLVAEPVARIYSNSAESGIPLEIVGIIAAIVTGFVYARVLKLTESRFGVFEKLALFSVVTICVFNLAMFFIFPHDNDTFLQNVVGDSAAVGALRTGIQSTLNDSLVLATLLIGIRGVSGAN